MIQAHEASKPGDWHFANFINAFCKTDNAVFEMCRDMHIALMEKDVRLYRSTLNADSSPLELCISMSANNVKYRLIGDPCPMESDAKRRMEYGKDALKNMIVRNRAFSLQPILFKAIDRFLPRAAMDSRFSSSGAMWLACGINVRGIALYLDGNCTSDERSWQKANTWLAEMLSYPDEAAGYIEKIRTFSRLASVGIEGLTPEDARVKFYWRLKKAIKISDGGLPLLGNELFSHFSSIIAEKRRMKLDGLVFGTGFNLASGRLVDSKLDICCAECCLDFSKDVWLKKLRRLGNAFHLKVPDMEEALLLEYCRGVLIGMGLDKNGGIRSNLYLKRV